MGSDERAILPSTTRASGNPRLTNLSSVGEYNRMTLMRSNHLPRTFWRSWLAGLLSCCVVVFSFGDAGALAEFAARLAGGAVDRSDNSTTDDDDETDTARFVVEVLSNRRTGRGGPLSRRDRSAQRWQEPRTHVVALVSPLQWPSAGTLLTFRNGAGAFLRC